MFQRDKKCVGQDHRNLPGIFGQHGDGSGPRHDDRQLDEVRRVR